MSSSVFLYSSHTPSLEQPFGFIPYNLLGSSHEDAYSLVIAAISLSIRAANAWGNMGREAIAYIAEDFVNSQTATFVQNTLGDTSDSYIANAATCVDSYRYTSSGSWSQPLHFIDANDSPPTSCSVEYDRDCNTGKYVVNAIMNFTAQLQDSSTSSVDLLNAMRFVIHFVGDIHQPLHDEALDVGGNTIDVTYNGDSRNLHRKPHKCRIHSGNVQGGESSV